MKLTLLLCLVALQSFGSTITQVFDEDGSVSPPPIVRPVSRITELAAEHIWFMDYRKSLTGDYANLYHAAKAGNILLDFKIPGDIVYEYVVRVSRMPIGAPATIYDSYYPYKQEKMKLIQFLARELLHGRGELDSLVNIIVMQYQKRHK